MTAPTPGVRPSERRRTVERRAAAVRRTAPDRRARERRVATVRVEREQRAGRDRRQAHRRRIRDRRHVIDRRESRRPTPSPFTVDEVVRIHDMFATVGAAIACPACGGKFRLGPSRRRNEDTVRRVQCAGCEKTAVITNSWMARVMVVEAEEVLREKVRAVIASAGHEVVETSDPESALELYRENPPDAVFMNAHALEQMDGRAFKRQLALEFPDVHIIAMSRRTTHGIANPLAVAKQLGASSVIRMPFSREDVQALLTEARR